MSFFWKKFKVGVFGSAGGPFDNLRPKAKIIGEEIAEEGGIVVTGGCPGLPFEAALGASSRGGAVIGISPAIDEKSHINDFKFPVEPHLLIFTGMEKKGRNIISIRTCDAGIFISGRSGTLNEFTSMYDESTDMKVIGLLSGTGGVVDHEIRSYMERTGAEKPTKATVIIDSDPKYLVQTIFRTLKAMYSVKC